MAPDADRGLGRHWASPGKPWHSFGRVWYTFQQRVYILYKHICLEHILSPEEFIIEMMKKLKKGGVLSISLPTDPGVLWRLGRLFIRCFTLNKTYKISKDEYEYVNATEHVNSIYNLINIISD